MANTDKNIVIIPNTGDANNPNIVFSGANASVANQDVQLTVLPDGSGTLLFSASSGNLIKIQNSQTESLVATSANITGNITAGFFLGNGSQLSGVIASTANSLANGTSNVSIPAAGGNVNTSVGGTANVLVVTSTGANITGTLNASGNANTGNIGATNGVFTNISGTLTTASQTNITAVGTLGNLTVTGNVSSGNLLGSHANGTSNVNMPTAGGNINMTVGGTANVLVVTSTGINVAGTLNTGTGNANVGNIGATTGVFTTINGVLANGTSNVSIPASGGNVNTSVGGTANVLVVTSTGINVAGTLNATGNANTGNIGATNGVFTNISGTLTGSLANGNSNVSIPAANGNVNISAVGNANILTVTGTGVNVFGTLNTGTGNANVGNLGSGNIFATGNVAAGISNPQANLHVANKAIIEGSAGVAILQIQKTGNTDNNIWQLKTFDTTGTLRLQALNDANTGGGSVLDFYRANNQITGASLTTNSTIDALRITQLGAGNAIKVEDVTNPDASPFLVDAAGNVGIGNVAPTDKLSIDGAAYLTGNVTANYYIGNGSQLTGITATTASSIANGTSNVSIPASGGNVNTSVGGTANILVVTSTGINVAGTLNTGTGNATVGNLIGVHANGNSNVNIATAGGNVTVAVAGNAAILTVTGTGVNVFGTLNTGTGNANVGNLGTTGNITANFYSGNGSLLTGIVATTASSLANGTSNVSIPAASGNVNTSVGGTANVLVVTSTGVNVAGTINSTGNTTVQGTFITQSILSSNSTGGAFTITTPAATSANTSGGNITLTTGTGLGTGSGGQFIVNGGTAPSTGFGGNIRLFAGAATTGGTGGSVRFGGGQGNTGGEIYIYGGNGTTNASFGNAGQVRIEGGTTYNGSLYGAYLKLSGGLSSASANNAGFIYMNAGTVNPGLPATGANGGNLELYAGDHYVSSANSGNGGTTTIAGGLGYNGFAGAGKIVLYGGYNAGGRVQGGDITIISGNTLAPTGAGTNLPGSNIVIGAGSGTGSGQSGNIILQTASILASGNANQTISNRVIIDSTTVNIVTSTNSTSTTTGALVVAGGVGISGNLYAGGIANITGNANVGNLGTTGNITAGYFFGNGSQLTGITATTASSIANGTSNVSIPASGGNINISRGGTANVLVITGTGINVAGTLNTGTGNANVGNLATDTAGRLITPTLAAPATWDLNIFSLTPAAANVDAPFVKITPGNGNGTGDGGQLWLIGGHSSNTSSSSFGGSVVIKSGSANASGGAAGTVSIYGGNGSGGTSQPGDVDISSGVDSTKGIINSAYLYLDPTTTPHEAFLSSGGANGTNLPGGNTYILGGKGTGTGTPGNVVIQTSNALQASGNTAQSLSDRVIISYTGMNVNAATNSTSTTTGALIVGGGVGISGNLYAGGVANITGNANVGNLGTAGLITATGNVTGNYFIGNGSLLTGITASAGTSITNGTSNVSIPASGGNVNTSVGGNANVMVVAGNSVYISAPNTALQLTGSLNSTSGNYGLLHIGGIAGTYNLANVASRIVQNANGVINTVVENISANVNAGVVHTMSLNNGQITTDTFETFLDTAGTYLTATKNLDIYSSTQSAGNLRLIAGNSNIRLASNGNMVVSSAGNINVLTVTGAGVNVFGTLNTGTGNANVGNLGTTGLITATGNVTGGNLVTSGVLSVTGNANVGNLGTTGNITASYFFGNGSQLTGISGGSGNSISNGTSNVLIATSGGNVNTSVAGTANVLQVTSSSVNVNGANGIIFPDSSKQTTAMITGKVLAISLGMAMP